MLLFVFEKKVMNRIKHKMISQRMLCTAANFRKFLWPVREYMLPRSPENGLPYSARVRNESDKHRIHAYALSRLLSLCCRFGTAAVLLLPLLLLLLLLLLGLFCSYYFAARVPGTFFFNYYCCCNSTVVRFLLFWMLGS